MGAGSQSYCSAGVGGAAAARCGRRQRPGTAPRRRSFRRSTWNHDGPFRNRVGVRAEPATCDATASGARTAARSQRRGRGGAVAARRCVRRRHRGWRPARAVRPAARRCQRRRRPRALPPRRRRSASRTRSPTSSSTGCWRARRRSRSIRCTSRSTSRRTNGRASTSPRRRSTTSPRRCTRAARPPSARARSTTRRPTVDVPGPRRLAPAPRAALARPTTATATADATRSARREGAEEEALSGIIIDRRGITWCPILVGLLVRLLQPLEHRLRLVVEAAEGRAGGRRVVREDRLLGEEALRQLQCPS